MRLVFVLALALLSAGAATAAAGITPQEYQHRRAELRKSLDGVMVLFGADEPDDLHTAFFQESNFLYLSGWREPGAAMLLTQQTEILFLPNRDPRMELYTGRKLDPSDPDAPKHAGFDRVMPRSALESAFLKVLETSPRVYTLAGDVSGQKLKSLAVLHEGADAGPAIARLRMVKSPAEIELIGKATDATVAAHLAGWKKTRPGVWEYEIAADMTNAYFERGCERNAYAPIVGSGPNSVILHYAANHRRLDAGETVVADVGAECSDYATDVTRTVPAGGKFTPRQREIYEIVLGAQKAAIAAIRPGMILRAEGPSLHQIAYDYINSHGHDLHGQPLGKYFVHGLGHYVGLDVHDPGDPAAPLKAGTVITIEPGIYIPEENIGIRIEDIVVVTAEGCKVLSAGLPREIADIEKLVGK
ncbi:MAG TPA: Xaa-Pro peptidase family protein [Bryobacteraceae bacterium]|jgi:Xaa-Pro aminopeptidase|nr:Xaa-Pro peptidase family protein [Bryobacteraceae bacterium]